MKRDSKRRYRRPAIDSGPARARDGPRARRLQQLCSAYLEAGMPEAAVDVALRALVLDPRNVRLRADLGLALYRRGDLEAALSWLEILRGDARADVDFLRGQILADLHRPRESLEAFELALKGDPQKIEAYIHRAALLLRGGEPGPAVSEITRLIVKDPGDPRALALRAGARLELGHAPEALADLRRIREEERTPEHVLLEARARRLGGGSAQEIEECLAAGIRRHPSNSNLRLELAGYLASLRNEDPTAAGRAAEAARVLAEGEPGAGANPQVRAQSLFLLGELTSSMPDRQDQAQSYYHRGLALRPDDPRGLSGLGALLLDQGRPAHALPWLLRSLLNDPERPETAELLARAFGAIPDDEALARWLGLICAGLTAQAPLLLAQLLRFVQEAGRADAYEEMRREAHRMKNLVAVLASRTAEDNNPQIRSKLQDLYREWTAFLEGIRRPSAEPALLSLGILVRRAVEEAAEDPARVHCLIPPGLPPIRGDGRGLQDALANIIRNALQASPPDQGVRVAVRWQKGDRFLEVAVTDRGAGISLQDRPMIFTAGFSRRPGGSGLGLAIAHRVILAHAGRIRVTSAPGGPTTFTVRLPAASLPVSEPRGLVPALALHRPASRRPGDNP